MSTLKDRVRVFVNALEKAKPQNTAEGADEQIIKSYNALLAEASGKEVQGLPAKLQEGKNWTNFAAVMVSAALLNAALPDEGDYSSAQTS